MSLPTQSARSTSRTSRPRNPRRNTSQASIPYIGYQGPEALLIADGGVGEEATELLGELIHGPSHEVEGTLVDGDTEPESDDADEDARLYAAAAEERKERSWWRRPSPWWFLCLMPLSSIAGGATIAPRIEIFTMLACDQHKPEYTSGKGLEGLLTGRRPVYSVLTAQDSGSIPVAITSVTSNEPFLMGNAEPIIDLDPEEDSPVIEPKPGNNGTVANPALCRTDPIVQAAVARLSATISTSQGILTILTTAWWGTLSDRYGRTTVVGATILGVLIMDFNFIFVSFFSRRLPGGYWFIIVGHLVEGLLGGRAAASAAVHAYVADCTEPAARSRVFSLVLGLLFIGMALGPTVGGILIRLTGNLMIVFYLATFVHLIYAFINWFILPESLSKAQMAAARRKYKKELANYKEQLAASGHRGAAHFARLRSLFSFVSVLGIFAPQKAENSNTLKGKKRDWSLTLVVLAYGFVAMLFGSYAYKMQYMLLKFDWTSENIGYWLSLVGAARALHLTIILPVVIKLFKPKAPAIQLASEADEPLDGPAPSGSSTSTTGSGQRPGHHHLGAKAHKHSATFDLNLARVSLFIEVVAYIAMPLAATASMFTIAAVLTSFGGGFNPAMNSVVVELFTSMRGGAASESGKLFGALSVVQTFASSVLGPPLFGLIYMSTVATMPTAIFWASVVCLFVPFLLLLGVRLPGTASPSADVEGHGREETLVDTSVPSAQASKTSAVQS